MTRKLNHFDFINLANCAQQRFKDAVFIEDSKYDRNRMLGEGRTVALWTRKLANLWDAYNRIN